MANHRLRQHVEHHIPPASKDRSFIAIPSNETFAAI
jgi:hypothetical protein